MSDLAEIMRRRSRSQQAEHDRPVHLILTEPVEHLFVRSELAKVETPVLDGLLADDETMTAIFGRSWYWRSGPGSEPIRWASDLVGPTPYPDDHLTAVVGEPEPAVGADGKIACPRCSRRVKPRRDGEPVRHYQMGATVWCK